MATVFTEDTKPHNLEILAKQEARKLKEEEEKDDNVDQEAFRPTGLEEIYNRMQKLEKAVGGGESSSGKSNIAKKIDTVIESTPALTKKPKKLKEVDLSKEAGVTLVSEKQKETDEKPKRTRKASSSLSSKEKGSKKKGGEEESSPLPKKEKDYVTLDQYNKMLAKVDLVERIIKEEYAAKEKKREVKVQRAAKKVIKKKDKPDTSERDRIVALMRGH